MSYPHLSPILKFPLQKWKGPLKGEASRAMHLFIVLNLFPVIMQLMTATVGQTSGAHIKSR